MTERGKSEGPTYAEMKKIAEAVSEASERLVPGFPGVAYSEKLLQRGSWDRFDARECLLLLASGPEPGTPPRGGEEDAWTLLREIDEDPKEARLRLLRGLADLGWPEAESAAEMRLKIAAMGDDAVRRALGGPAS